MKQGRMYKIKNLGKNKLNTCMRTQYMHRTQGEVPELQTENPRYMRGEVRQYRDGALAACVGIEYRDTYHYCKQPFYKLLMLDGTIAMVSKGTRQKYFELVRGV